MISKSQLESEFLLVREKIFPRWDKDKVWSILFGNFTGSPGEEGCCVTESKVVHVAPFTAEWPREKRQALIIHEICHAVVGPGHAKKFLERMRKAAETAERHGLHNTAKHVLEDVVMYEQTPKTNAAEVYGLVQDWLIERPDLTASQIENALVRTYGLTNEQVRVRYPRILQVTEDVKSLYLNKNR